MKTAIHVFISIIWKLTVNWEQIVIPYTFFLEWYNYLLLLRSEREWVDSNNYFLTLVKWFYLGK